MNQWQISRTARVFGFPAIEHSLTGEMALISKQGDLWEYSENKVGVLVRSPTMASKIAKYLKIPFKNIAKGEEAVFVVDRLHTAHIRKMLKITKFRASQAKVANSL